MKLKWIIFLALWAGTFALYWPARHYEFVNYDDEGYLYENNITRQGLTWNNFLGAFTRTDQANYHPLVWLSLEADVSLFGLDPGKFHAENAAIYALTASLLFLFLLETTGNIRCAAFAAALFAVHPLHVESVAWVTERKDVLAGLFFALSLLAYLRYCRRKGRSRWLAYSLLSACLILGLLSKSSLVTFPFVLLLFDYWPMRRAFSRRLILEKIPLLLFSAAASVATYLAQSGGGATVNVQALPVSERLINASLSYCRYLTKFFVPTELSVFYPRLHHPSLLLGLICFSLLILVTILCFRLRQSAGYLIVGWLLFLGILVPMLGLVQVGWQSIADRYMYLAMTGPTLMLTYGAADIFRNLRQSIRTKIVAPSLSVLTLASGAILTRHQLQYWHDTRALFSHAIDLNPANSLAWLQLGYLESRNGNVQVALADYYRSVQVDPTYFVAQYDLANLLLQTHKPQLAALHYQQAAASQSSNARIQNNWGVALLQLNRLAEAVEHLSTAARLDPQMPDPHLNLARLYMMQHQPRAAEKEFHTTLRLSPDNPAAIDGLQSLGREK